MGSFGKTQSWVLAEDEAALKSLGWEPSPRSRKDSRSMPTRWPLAPAPCGVAISSHQPPTENLDAVDGLRDDDYRSLGERLHRSESTLCTRGPGCGQDSRGGRLHQTYAAPGLDTNRPQDDLPEAVFSDVYGSFGRVTGSFDAELARAKRSGNSEPGKLPPWFPRFPGSEQIETVPAIAMVEFIVCGDPARNAACRCWPEAPGLPSRRSSFRRGGMR